MRTVRITLDVNEALLAEVMESRAGTTKTALVEQGLRALLGRDAANRLAEAGGTVRTARRPKRSAFARR
jgi:Arc/MetJ family transcription regulator